jgi:predicted HicB family RNase H-like nuclease
MDTKQKPPSSDKRLVRLDLPAADHQAVRLAAARQGVSMAEFSRRAVVEAARKTNGTYPFDASGT